MFLKEKTWAFVTRRKIGSNPYSLSDENYNKTQGH